MDDKRLTRRTFLKGSMLLGGAVVLGTQLPALNHALAAASRAVLADLPRRETLYFNGLQFSAINGWNPYTDSMNNALALNQAASAIVTIFETPYVFNLLTGEQVPLLADGPYTWNAEQTEITFQIKAAAKWRDGTSVTAEDVAYTWATHLQYGTDVSNRYAEFIEDITAVDTNTVMVKAKLDEENKVINPLQVAAYLSDNYVIQKAWTQILEARSGGDPDTFKNDPATDFVSSGPYYNNFYEDDQIVVLVRDDEYWGQDASMWGKLPVPKYLAHVIYADNDSALAAFKAGQVDVSQMFIPNVQDLWLADKLPIATYMPEAPYGICASLPSAYYNTNSYGLDNATIRKAIAMAVDYDAIIANSMKNQSPTFTQVPRSVMNPTPYEQSMYDQEAVKDLQWSGGDIDGAKALLDAAGIVDTDSDGYREYNGQKLTYNAVCPNGWVDWMGAAAEIALAGQAIGIDIQDSYPEWTDYMNVFTDGTQTEYDIFMAWTSGAGPTSPWGRVRWLMSSEWHGMQGNWNGNWGGYVNPAIDDIIKAIPNETDPVALKQLYTDATQIYLTDVPSFAVMYRPEQFYTVNETVWTNYPKEGDGTDIPPLVLIFGYGIAALYRLTLQPLEMFIPMVQKN